MIVAILLLGYGGLALWLGFTVGHRMRRFSALIWAHDQVMAMWRRVLDAPEPTVLRECGLPRRFDIHGIKVRECEELRPDDIALTVTE